MSTSANDAMQPTERQTLVLAHVVREYVRSAQPVPSSQLARRHRLGVSASSVRADLATLEEMGLLTHPHTSAGRVPTPRGYRFFVENLMRAARLPEHEMRAIRSRFVEAGGDPERWMQLSAAVIAQTSGLAGVVATPRVRPAPLRRLEMVDLDGGVVQIVAVLASGEVRQARWCPGRPFDQNELDRLARYVNDRLVGIEPTDWRVPPAASEIDSEGVAVLQELLVRTDEPEPLRLYHAGLAQILRQPEFAIGEGLRAVIAILEQGDGLLPALELLPGSGVRVIIGGEPPLELVPHVTLVLSRFGEGTNQDGILGVVGPTRLQYERAVPAVEFVAGLMTRLLTGDTVLTD